MEIIIETSARHVHLCEADLKILFGEEARLTKRRDLSQPGQFVSNEKVDVVGPRDTIKGVSVMGPLRSKTQVEVSLTDARKLGINAPVKVSGNIEGTPGCKLVGPNGEINIENGVIAAKRHIHINTETASKEGFKENQNVNVKVSSDERSLIFDDVVIRISEDFKNAMHIDTDESNAAGAVGAVTGEIIE